MLERTKERLFRKQEAEKPKSIFEQLKEDTAEAKKELSALQKMQAMQAKALTKEQINEAFKKVQEKEQPKQEQTHTQRKTHRHGLSL